MKKAIFYIVLPLICFSCFKKKIELDLVENENQLATTATDKKQTKATNHKVKSINKISEIKKITFEEAEKLNTSVGWRRFLKDNPNFEDKDKIEELIIRAEVEEIKRNKETGEIPESEQVRGGNQAISNMKISNETACDLILRYSGPEAKKVIISANSKSNVQLKSGNYSVVATACGYNYAGSEVLSGDYEVIYYINMMQYE